MLDKFKKEFKTIKEININEVNNAQKQFQISLQERKKADLYDEDEDEK